MSDSHEQCDRDGVPFDVACQIDALCDEFESALSGQDAPALAGYVDRVDSRGRRHLLEELAGLALEHLVKQNVANPADALLSANAHLREELQLLLTDSVGEVIADDAPITGAREKAAQSISPQVDTRSHHVSNTGSGHLEVRCPNCHMPMEVAVDTLLTDLTCSSCGSHFSLVDQTMTTRMAPSLSKVGRFELIERIGVGGFGSVWKARDKELDRTVAVKIPRQSAMTAEEQEKFFREARAAAQLQHPSIVCVHEVGRDGDSVYIVSDFVRGVTLGDWLTGQRLTSREAADLCAKSRTHCSMPMSKASSTAI